MIVYPSDQEANNAANPQGIKVSPQNGPEGSSQCFEGTRVQTQSNYDQTLDV
jgi:hypothetical protein